MAAGAHLRGITGEHRHHPSSHRGQAPGHCFLVVPDWTGQDAYQRLVTLERSTDGFHIAEADLAFKPASLDMTQAAALPLVALTAWQVLVERAQAIGMRLARVC